MTLTDRQRRVVDFVGTYTALHNYGPSVREIGAGVGLSSTSSVAHVVATLRAMGLLEADDNKARTLRLSGPVEDHLQRKACPVCLGSGVDPNEQVAS